MNKSKKRVKEIYDEIEVLNNELKEIRENCSHDSYKIGIYSWRVGNYQTKRICLTCYEPIGNPTNREEIEYQSNNKNGQGLKIYKNN